jgi:hypothetical protein
MAGPARPLLALAATVTAAVTAAKGAVVSVWNKRRVRVWVWVGEEGCMLTARLAKASVPAVPSNDSLSAEVEYKVLWGSAQHGHNAYHCS